MKDDLAFVVFVIAILAVYFGYGLLVLRNWTEILRGKDKEESKS